MTVSEVFHNKHKHDVYLERQIQESLLLADDEFSRKDFLDVIKKTKHNPTKKKGRKKADDDEFCELSGWVPDKNVTYRKREKCDEDSGKSSSREFISWRDSRSCTLPRHRYIFRHYKDTKRYIEQYRKDCTCSKNTGIPSSKEYLDFRRSKGYEKCSMVPNTKTMSHKSESKGTNSKPHTGTFSYTNRSVSNPFNVYTDFFSGKHVGRVMESNVEQILQSDTECCAENDLFARKYTRRESATCKYGKNSATDITTTPLLGNNHQRIASGTKLPSPSKIRTLDGLSASPDYQYYERSESEYTDSTHRSSISSPSPEEISRSPTRSKSPPPQKEDAEIQSETITESSDEKLHVVDEQGVDIKSAPVIRRENKPLSGKRRKTLDSPSLISLKDSRFTQPHPTFCAFTAEYTTASIVGQEKRVWKPVRSTSVDRERELKRGLEAGMNCPFKVKDISVKQASCRNNQKQAMFARGELKKGNTKGGYYSKENIDPPGKTEAVLVKTGPEDNEFPQPMCFTIKKGSVKTNQCSNGVSAQPGPSSTPKAKHLSSTEEVLRMRKILSNKVGNGTSDHSASNDKNVASKDNYTCRTESSYRQKIVFPTEELVPSTRATVGRTKAANRQDSSQGIPTMPSIMYWKCYNSVDVTKGKKTNGDAKETEYFPRIPKPQGQSPKQLLNSIPPSGNGVKVPPIKNIVNSSNNSSDVPRSAKVCSAESDVNQDSPKTPICSSPWISDEGGSKYIPPANKFSTKSLPPKLQGSKDTWACSTPTEQKLKELAEVMVTEGQLEGDVSKAITKKRLKGMKQGPSIASGIDGEKTPHRAVVSLKSHPDARIDNICKQDQSNSSGIISKQCTNAQTCCGSPLSDPSHTFQANNESVDTASGDNGSSVVPTGASSTVFTDVESQRPMSVFSRSSHLSLGKLQDINSRNTSSSLSSQSIDSMTWREKLQALRKVDKPRFKRQGKPRRLSSCKEDNIVGKFEIGCYDPCLTHRKKIQELIENSKIKLKTICTEMDQTLVGKHNRLNSDVLGNPELDIDTIINSVRDCQIQNVDDKTRAVCKTKT